MLSSRLVLLVLVVLVCSGLAVELVELVPVSVPVLAVLVVFVLAVVVLVVLVLVLVLVDWLLLAEAFCAAHGSGPTRASSSRVASIHTRRALLAKMGVKTGEHPGNSGNQWQRITLWNGGEGRVKEH
jgi:hypothetical protein